VSIGALVTHFPLHSLAGTGFRFPLLLAWVAGFFEVALSLAFLTGLFLGEAAVVSVGYVLFLVFVPRPRPLGRQHDGIGFFTDRFVFVAGLLFAAVRGPGDALVPRTGLGSRRK
jgi:putative oxidoreductase